MLASLLQSMLPPGFDLEKTIAQVQQAIVTTVATVQRIEAKVDALAARNAEQAATLHPTLTQGNPNDDRQQHAAPGIDYAAPGDVNASPGDDGNGGDRAA